MPKREKQPMSMEEYADRITYKLAVTYHEPIEKIGLWNIIFDAICLFQEMKEQIDENPQEQYWAIKEEKKRQEG